MKNISPNSSIGVAFLGVGRMGETHLRSLTGLSGVEAPQKTPLLFAKDFSSSFDHFENFPDRFAAAYRLELEAFFTALQQGKQPSPGPQDALETLRLALAAAQSWRESRPEKVSEIRA
jgi:myo-inositol 2-dehydrogenase / D-chiro-inositol 1-dehydrogenase